MPTESKRTSTSHPFNQSEIAAAKAAAVAVPAFPDAIDWTQGVRTQGGGVAATVTTLRRTRGPNKNPTKEQVAIRLDPEVLRAFRAGGPGWQTRMNAALKEWLTQHPAKRKPRRQGAA